MKLIEIEIGINEIGITEIEINEILLISKLI